MNKHSASTVSWTLFWKYWTELEKNDYFFQTGFIYLYSSHEKTRAVFFYFIFHFHFHIIQLWSLGLPAFTSTDQESFLKKILTREELLGRQSHKKIFWWCSFHHQPGKELRRRFGCLNAIFVMTWMIKV